MTTSRRPADLRSIQQLIEQQVTCAGTLLETLERERQALLDNSMTALERASSDKLAAATTLQTLNGALQKLDAGPQQIELMIREAGSPTLDTSWRELLQLAARCQQTNLGNGALLDERQTQVRRQLRALPPAAGGTLYGRDGHNSDPGSGRSARRLASA